MLITPFRPTGILITLLLIVGIVVLYQRQSLSVPGLERWKSTKSADSGANDSGAGAEGGGVTEPPAPSVETRRKMVVMASTQKDDTSWVAELADSWDSSVYHVDDPTAALTVPKNKGNEGMSYLTFIIDNYDNLPPITAFVHAHKDGYPQAWHTDAEGYSNVNSLKTLKLDYVRQEGYVNLRCIWTPGCPDEIQPFRKTDKWRSSEHVFLEAWDYIFGKDVAAPKKVGQACCAQFAVTAEQVKKRPKAVYERVRQWLLDTELKDEISGRVMEYIWHILFGKDPVFCPEVYTCRCNLYGRDCSLAGLYNKE